MAVATIGVFGVMVMIPFAVKQSQTGLDNDAANALGRNAVEDIQLQGLFRSGAINRPDTSGSVPVDVLFDGLERIVMLPADESAYRHFNLETIPAPWGEPPQNALHFDPVGVAAGLNSFSFGTAGVETIVINSGSLTNDISPAEFPVPPTLVPISTFEANRLCRSSDDMVYKTDSDDDVLDTAPPQPIFDRNAAGDLVKRQSIGRISWSTFMVPEKSPVLTSSPASRFRTFTAVYRDRFIDPAPAARIASNYGTYRTSMAGTGYVANVNQIFFDDMADSDATPVDTEEVVRGSWVMLVNRLPEPIAFGNTVNAENTAADDGNRLQVSFARVTRVSDNGRLVTIDGGPFEFVDAGVSGAAGGPASTNTYMIHLKNVVNVYERSISVER